MSCYFVQIKQRCAAFLGLFGLAALVFFADLLRDAIRGSGGLLTLMCVFQINWRHMNRLPRSSPRQPVPQCLWKCDHLPAKPNLIRCRRKGSRLPVKYQKSTRKHEPTACDGSLSRSSSTDWSKRAVLYREDCQNSATDVLASMDESKRMLNGIVRVPVKTLIELGLTVVRDKDLSRFLPSDAKRYAPGVPVTGARAEERTPRCREGNF